MKNFFAKMIDSRNGEVEAHLVLLCCGAFVFIALSIYHVVMLQHIFDPESYGQGLGYLLAGSGAAAWGQGMQRKNESDATGKDGENEPGQ